MRRDRGEHGAVGEQGLAGERRQDLGDRAGGEDHDGQVAAGGEDVAQVLVQQRRAALAGVEEDAVELPVDLEHRQRGDHHRADHDQDPADHRRGPGERGHPPPGETRAPASGAGW